MSGISVFVGEPLRRASRQDCPSESVPAKAGRVIKVFSYGVWGDNVMTYDFAIIGGGHNGLVAGTFLAKAGRNVIVLEKEDVVGGAVKTRELTLPGFKHDQFSAFHPLFVMSPVYEELKEDLSKNEVKYFTFSRCFASIFPDGDSVLCYSDLGKTLCSLEKHSKADADAWNDLYSQYLKIKAPMLSMMYSPFSAFSMIKAGLKFCRALGRQEFMRFLRQVMMSPRDFADYFFKSEKAKAWIVPWAFHPDYGPDVSAGSMFALLTAGAQQELGLSAPEGGGGMLTLALSKVIESQGGEVITDAHVTKITVKDGKAVGVELIDGSKIEAKRGVIASLEPRQLFFELVGEEHLNGEFLALAKGYRYGVGGMKIDLALDSPVEWIAGEEVGKTGFLHVGPYVNDIARAYHEAICGLLPSDPFIFFGNHTVLDPRRAPEGKHTGWILVRGVPSEIKGDAAGKIGSTDWDDVKKYYADRVIDKVTEYAPNFKDIIIGMHIQSPVDFERNDLNLVGGDMVSGSHHLDQNYMFRPFPGFSKYKTPIKNLYMTGASTYPGGGMNGASGYIVAKLLC
ncbi:MAG: NAD(P)/FAD-dependent oxidoreductase [Thermodesulfobacteriota bacterium]|nr:NAD(P)/FAD-dependent oxidoreductase [Thermodesulfobacteriota bacterium]